MGSLESRRLALEHIPLSVYFLLGRADDKRGIVYGGLGVVPDNLIGCLCSRVHLEMMSIHR